MAVSLERAKSHLRVLHDDEDADIQAYLNAAEAYVLKYCNRETIPVGATSVFEASALLVLGDLYENRESQADISLYENKSAHRLVDPYRFLRV